MIISFAYKAPNPIYSGNSAAFGFKSKGNLVPPSLSFARVYYAASPTQMFIRFGFPERGVIPVVVSVVDTHDGLKKKKKKKQRDFTEELERTERLRKQIEEVIHPQIIEVIPVEEPEPEIAKEVRPVELKSFESPIVDYAGLAKEQIVAKLKGDAAIKAKEQQRILELRRLEEQQEEEELEMILMELL